MDYPNLLWANGWRQYFNQWSVIVCFGLGSLFESFGK